MTAVRSDVRFALRAATSESWAERAWSDPHALLSDHAHCELRAASSAQALITRNPEHGRLVDHLGRLATEEMRHFRRVVKCLRSLGGELAQVGPNPYVAGLFTTSAATRDDILLDRLLIAGFIETRSHERFVALERAAPCAATRELYARLGPSEEAHGELFAQLALEQFPEPRVAGRIDQLAELESALLASLPFAHRVHAGEG